MAHRFVRATALVAVAALVPCALIDCASPRGAHERIAAVRPAPLPTPSASLRAAAVPPARVAGTARVAMVVDESFGLKMPDPYRWMEEPRNDELSQWMHGQGVHTRAALAAIPGREALFERVRAMGLGVARLDQIQVVGDRLFYLKLDKGSDLRALVVREADGIEHTLVDPAKIPSTDGAHVSVDHFRASPDGKWVAYGLAQGGGEIATEHVIARASGRERDVPIEHIWGEFEVSWFPDSDGFFYTQIPREAFADPSIDKLQNMRALAHRLGDPIENDVVVLAPGTNGTLEVAPHEFPFISVSTGQPWVFASMGGARDAIRVYVAPYASLGKGPALGKSVPWRRVAEYDDAIANVKPHGEWLYLHSKKGAPNGRVLRMSAKTGTLEEATTALAESDAVVEAIAAASDALYVALQRDGHAFLKRLSYSDNRAEDVPLPSDAFVDDLHIDNRRPGVVLATESWTHEPAYYKLDPKTKAFTEIHITPKTDGDFSAIVAEERTVSHDGVDVPLTILHRRDLTLDGARPTILFGYGAYGISMFPTYRPYLLPWLDQGGVWAIAHVRGGGEKGDAWRAGGVQDAKPNSWRDFNACAEWLIQHRYTSKRTLAAYSASAGGVLVGRAITERPDLYAAAMIYAGIVNATRYVHGSNGANQRHEMGPDDTADGMRALLAMDAFQNVKDGVPYPAVMLATGLNDARVSPWMSAKLAARMQAATSSGKPILLRVESDEGHGVGSTREQRLRLWADMFSFFSQQMN